MKTILGLDLGTNSIGWTLLQRDELQAQGNILAAGCRIIPMSQDVLGKFDSGISESQTAERTRLRSIRRLRERHLLRRERLHRVLHILGFLPEHYARQIDFKQRPGQFLPESEPKLAYCYCSETGKADFIFKNSFSEMLADFEQYQPQLLANGRKVPYDWTIYYLRKKALKQKISKEELAWLLIHFNQKRGYYQLRGEEEEETPGKSVAYYSLRVNDVVATEDKKNNGEVWYNVHLENGWIYRRTSKVFLDWKGKTKEFIVTTELNEDGSVKIDKEGNERRSFRAPAENDWTLIKKKTEHDIEQSEKTVGAYIYDSLLHMPHQKINGKLVRVIERKLYKTELEAILKTQQALHPELTDAALYNTAINELYRYNIAHKNNIKQKGFTHLFLNDIIFYQRPLKSKKALIGNCPLETRPFKKDGIKMKAPVKCIAKSHPLFQEFRIWQWIQNLKIYKKENDEPVTTLFIASPEDRANLFDWLNSRKEVDHKALLNYLLKPKISKLKIRDYRWNYVYDPVKDESKSYPCNETRSLIKARLSKIDDIAEDFLTTEREEALWHILYSVEDKTDVISALHSFATRHGLGNEFVAEFSKFPPFKKEYAAYSAKALKKLLPLMRCGHYWDATRIDAGTAKRIEALLNGEYHEKIRERVREKAINLLTPGDFSYLPLWLASYIVYDRHSEDGDTVLWETADQITLLKQYSLRNPVVEQIINETLQLVRCIWQQYGDGAPRFFQEIHIELGREMKNPVEQRREMSRRMGEHENTNLRVKAMLIEMLDGGHIDNVRPYSPMQQEILKIYEEGVLNATANNIPDDMLKISKLAQPSQTELQKYILWLQQKYKSPYTGATIPLSKLFTPEYEIEHIIPQSRYFDDSMNNKVICEAAVNKDKDNMLGYEYVKSNYGKIIRAGGKEVRIFTLDEYEHFVKEHYSRNRNKMKKLLMEDIPEAFIQRQLNDSRYISKVVRNLMSNIVRDPDEQEPVSKHVVTTNGAITNKLKQDWGLNEIWNEIVAPRFERLNKLTGTSNFGSWTSKDGKHFFQTQVPLTLQKGFNKKRIDHRHHTLDAIVIACTTRDHINLLNNETALGKASREEKDKRRYDLKHKLCLKKYNDNSDGHYSWVFRKPWDTFTQESRQKLLSTVVSFKQNLRIINKTTNYYQTWIKGTDGILQKKAIKQTQGDNWAIRKPMHKDTVAGSVKLQFKKPVTLSNAIDQHTALVNRALKAQISTLVHQGYDKKKIMIFFKEHGNQWMGTDVAKPEVYYWDETQVASREQIDESFNSSKIGNITDKGIQKIMLRHLKQFNEQKNGKIIEHPELAFAADGLNELNRNIITLNNGKPHHPIYKVRTREVKGNKFAVGQTGNKKDKYVETAKGTNLFFAIYTDAQSKRYYETVPFNIVMERLKQGQSTVPLIDKNGHKLLMYLSPNDLVYVPVEDEMNTSIDFENLCPEQTSRIYRMEKASGKECYFIQHNIAELIFKYDPQYKLGEFGSQNKLQTSIDGIKITETCIKLKIDRLGNIRRSMIQQ